MSTSPFVLFRRIYLVVFLLIALLGIVFTGITYLATTSFYETSTQLLNKDVASHIARFTSPYGREGFDRQKADSVFYDAMVISPSAEVYFLDTTGKVIYYHGAPTEIKSAMVSLAAIHEYLLSGGTKHITGPDPRDPGHRKIFSAAAVEGESGRVGYIYVVLGSQQYRSVTQMLYNSRITPSVLVTVVVILAISLGVTMLYLKRMRVRFDELVNAMGKRFREGDFMVNLSHDLRTPLAIARGYGETLLLKKGELPLSEERAYMELVVDNIRQVEGTVNQLFELAKIESPSFEAHREPFVLSEMLGEVMRAVGAQQRIEQRGMEDGSWIEADVAMMERVLQNLVVNAMAYTPAGGWVAVSLFREGDKLLFSIENEGPPLAAGLLDWINGGQVRPARPAIGLTIVRKILQLHGYRLRAESREGKNLFTVWMNTFDTHL